jgi:hypothetical protein
MKKVLLLLVLFGMLSMVTPVYAADVDGLWAGSDPEGSPVFAMARENGGLILFTILDYWEGRMAAWIPLAGPFDGTTGNLFLILTSEANGNIAQSLTGTFSLTTPATATLTLTSCTNFPQQDNCGPVGAVINFVKIF